MDEARRSDLVLWLTEHGWNPTHAHDGCTCRMTASMCNEHTNLDAFCFGIIPSGTICRHGNTGPFSVFFDPEDE